MRLQVRGGIAGLRRLYREHRDALEADLQIHAHTDLRDLHRPGAGLTWRRLAVLVRYLPTDAHTVALLGGPAAAWRLEHYLLADVWRAAAHSTKPHPAVPDHSKLQRVAGRSKTARQDQRLRAQQRRIAAQRAQQAPTDQ